MLVFCEQCFFVLLSRLLNCASELLETLRSRFGHLTANGKPRFAASSFTLSVFSYLGIAHEGNQKKEQKNKECMVLEGTRDTEQRIDKPCACL